VLVCVLVFFYYSLFISIFLHSLRIKIYITITFAPQMSQVGQNGFQKDLLGDIRMEPPVTQARNTLLTFNAVKNHC